MAAHVLALTTLVEGKYRAATVTAAVIVSIEPLQVLVSIEVDSQMKEWIARSGIFGLSILSRREQVLADRFAGFAPLVPADFHGIDYFTAHTGVPLLTHALGWVDCRVEQSLGTGDHHCFVGQVIAMGQGPADSDQPLVYYRNRYWSLD